MAEMSLAELTEKLGKLGDELDKNLRNAVRLAAQTAATEARTTTAFRDRTSELRNSIDADDFVLKQGDEMSAEVSAGAPYASYVERGTKPHKIKPRFRKSLRWPVEGGFAFARVVNHPGTKPTRFLETAVVGVQDRLAEQWVPDAIELSFVRIGFAPG